MSVLLLRRLIIVLFTLELHYTDNSILQTGPNMVGPSAKKESDALSFVYFFSFVTKANDNQVKSNEKRKLNRLSI